MSQRFHLDPDEVVQRRVNRSLIDLVPVSIASGSIIMVVLYGTYIFARFPDMVPFVTPGVIMVVSGTLIAIAILMLVSAVYVHHHNYLLITNLHLLKLEQNGLFHQATSQLGLARVQDVKGERRGFFGTLFNYGNVVVQTAGESENFVFRAASHPQILADELLHIHEEFVKAHPGIEL